MAIKACSVDILSYKVANSKIINIKNKKNKKRLSMNSYFIDYMKQQKGTLTTVACSGRSAILLSGGTTTHSRFRYPFPFGLSSYNKQKDVKNENVIIETDNKKENINIRNDDIIDFDDCDKLSDNKNSDESQSESDDSIVDDISIINSDEDYEVNSSSEEQSSSVSSSDSVSVTVDIQWCF